MEGVIRTQLTKLLDNFNDVYFAGDPNKADIEAASQRLTNFRQENHITDQDMLCCYQTIYPEVR